MLLLKRQPINVLIERRLKLCLGARIQRAQAGRQVLVLPTQSSNILQKGRRVETQGTSVNRY